MAGSMKRTFYILLFNCFIFLASADQTNITTHPGDTVILPCKAGPGNTVLVVQWSRSDLGLKDVALLFRDEQIDLENQHPSFKGRVDLQDRQMKDGNLNLVLKDVMTDDRGTYECRVVLRRSKRRKRGSLQTAPISTVHLDVASGVKKGETNNGDRLGHLGLKAAFVVIFIHFLI